MSIVCSASTASRLGRRALGMLAISIAVALTGLPALASPNVTEVVVRFRDAAIDAEPAATPTPTQFEILSRSLRTGIAAWSSTLDGGFRVVLAPSMPFVVARDAVNRLRTDDGILYASIGATDAPPSARGADEKKAGTHEPPLDRLIVRYRDPRLAGDASADRPLATPQLDAIAAIAGVPVAHERAMTWARAQIVQLFRPLPREQVEAIAQRIAQQPDVLWAQPDYIDQIQFTPNDPLYANQWHYFEPVGGAGLTLAWDRTKGWSGINVGVADTGILFGHPDLAGRVVGGYDFIIASGSVQPNDGDNRDPDPSDPGDWIAANQCGFPHQGQNSSWHGTHVTGTIGAASNNALGLAGINFVSRIVQARVLGMCGGRSSDIADGLFWAAGGTVAGVPTNPHPARVVNMSLGGRRTNQTCDNVYQTAVNGALANNVAVVVSAGNSSEDASFSAPANCSGVITVAATGRAGQRASYSNHDVNDASGVQVEIAAPGGSSSDGEPIVLSTLNNGTTTPATHNYVQYQGTSMAAPHVTGIVSLLLSLKPSLTPSQVLAILSSTARAFPTGTVRDCTSNLASATGTTRYCGAGIVDANAALTSIMNTGGPGGTPLTAATATLASSLNPASFGQSVTFTATVTGAAPTGTVNFTDNGTTLSGCGAVALTGSGNSRTAQCTTASLSAGAHPIVASYNGTTTNTPADSNLVQQQIDVAGSQATTTAVSSSLNPSTPGAGVTLTATVTNQLAPAATGSVGFTADGVTISGCAAVALVAGPGTQSTANCTTSGLAAGQRSIVASYSGNASHQPSASPGFTQSVTSPTACAGFNDVASSSSFCSNLGWLMNRYITEGCVVGAFCPDNAVIRLAMAASQNRQGAALTPFDLAVAEEETSTLTLATPQRMCQTDSYAVTDYPRRAYLRGRANPFAAATTSVYSIEHVVSTDGGATWQPVPGSMVFQSLSGGLSPADDKTVALWGVVDLDVGTTYRFAQRITRTGGSADPGYYCTQFVQIRNRNGASPPF